MKNFFLSCKEFQIEPTLPKTFYGSFYLGPFSESYALTVANALRRTLLSDISGIAITSVRIEGALHEYSSLTGVRETVLDILLNLKEIVLKNQSKNPLLKTQIGYLQVRGPGIVRASDLKLPPLLQCIDPEQYIATLSENGKLNLTFTIAEGKNFIFQKNPSTFSTVNTFNQVATQDWLAIDAVFTPIKKVNYTVQALGSESLQKTNQIILLEIWTNGSLDPKEAVSKALNTLRFLFNQLGELKVLQSLVTDYSLNRHRKFRKIFTDFSTDLDLSKFTFYKKKSFHRKSLKTKFQEVEQQASKFSKDEKNGLNTRSNPQKTRELLSLGLPYRFVAMLLKANITEINQLKEMTDIELKKKGLFREEFLFVLKETLKKTTLPS
jgi:DNA-directed RNA polymerase subunit alpha